MDKPFAKSSRKEDTKSEMKEVTTDTTEIQFLEIIMKNYMTTNRIT